jgi:hypothetical protein
MLEMVREVPDLAIAWLNNLLRRCREITGLDDDEIIRRTDFVSTDLHHDRLDSMLGELRSVVFLADSGCELVDLQKAVNGRRRADIIAVRRGRRYAFDVFTPTKISSKWLSELQAHIAETYGDKTTQLATTREELKCDASGLIVVLNADRPLMFETHDDYLRAAREILAAVGNPSDTHFAFLTGRVTDAGGPGSPIIVPDDVIEPPLPCIDPITSSRGRVSTRGVAPPPSSRRRIPPSARAPSPCRRVPSKDRFGAGCSGGTSPSPSPPTSSRP